MSEQSLCVCVGERKSLMDGLVYAARGVHGGEEREREISVLRGGHEGCDVIDLTGPVSPEERESD